MQRQDRLGRRSLPPGTLRPQSPQRRRRDPKTGTVYTFSEWESSHGTDFNKNDVIEYWNHVLELSDYQPNGRFRNHGADASRYIQGPALDRRIERWVHENPTELKLGSEGPITRHDFGCQYRDSGTLSFRDILLIWNQLPHDEDPSSHSGAPPWNSAPKASSALMNPTLTASDRQTIVAEVTRILTEDAAYAGRARCAAIGARGIHRTPTTMHAPTHWRE